MRPLLTALLAFGCLATDAPAQNPRIAAVENGLLPSLRIRGQVRAMRLADRMAFHHVPGVSIAVIDSGRVVWARGYGVREAGGTAPVDTATLFQAASISKPVTSAAALQLVRRGTLTLTGDVNTWLRSWRVPENAFTRERPVTLEQLLSHTAGLSVSGFPGYDVDSALPTVVQILDGARPANTDSIRVTTLPGSVWRYSGGGYTVAQQLLVDVTRRPFPEYLRRTVLEPLRMRRSTFAQPLPPQLARNAASAHESDGTVVHGKWHVYPELAAAGLWTTPSDLARFAIAVQEAAGGRGNAALTPEIVADMLTERAAASSYGLGLGVFGQGDAQRFNHTGGNWGFACAMVAYTRRGQGAVVMTNGANGSRLIGEIVRSIAAEYGWPGYLPPERDVVAVAATLLDEYVGVYRMADGTEITVSREGDALYGLAGRDPRSRLWPTTDSTFIVESQNVVLRFERDASRQVTGFVLLRPGPESRATRVR
jgi:CubicO group peptidase (beta-lactamase class C family)